MRHEHSDLGIIGSNELVADRGTAEGAEARSPSNRNRSQTILDDIFTSPTFREIERGWIEEAKRTAERRAKVVHADCSSRPMANVQARREFGTYRGKP